MSMPPDFMNQLLNGQNGLYSPTMGLALGLLQAGGPSRMPTSLGQALGAGMQQGQQFQQAGLQNAMQQLMLGQKMYGMQALQDAFSPSQSSGLPAQSNAAQAQIAPTIGIDAASATQGLGAPSNAAPLNPFSAASMAQPNSALPIPQGTAPQSQQDWTPQAQQRMDQYLKLSKAAAFTQNPQLSSYADGLKSLMQNSWHPMSDAQIQTYTGGKSIPGYGYFVNELGEPKTIGTDAVKPSQGYDQYGNLIAPLTDVRSGKAVGPASGPIQRQPGTPLPGPLESAAQGLAGYTQDLDGINKRGMTGLLLKQRAAEINPGWDETTYPAKKKAMESLAAGPDSVKMDSLNTIQSHLGTYSQAMQALNNGDFQTANKLANAVNLKLGKDPIANVNAIKALVSGELARATAAGVVTEADKGQANEILNNFNSPSQTEGVLNNLQSLLGGKMESIKIRALANHIPEDVFNTRLSPAARQALQSFEASPMQQTASNNGLPPGWSVVQH